MRGGVHTVGSKWFWGKEGISLYMYAYVLDLPGSCECPYILRFL
jgi:hypothetical protein